ncbi:hypothetical protein B7755_028915 [Streptomyces sp. NBS 14/10]|uniref:hypothetical protein n=1 Tax=Streptomyces sp. NBS 14/10 TaxID=1945643 RepID=UPI000B7D90C6|nr:hypothetical protein [Streptomyces sp. NBS 14/10]KAK1181810.1 hypothetical protein B7755_028915 [Streptomyces sp. NBS 14/10]NUP35562.1 hypothetical protein [Streptomyces sp.]NUS81986.1 hypothetical protein [Streptomyces sp.]
MTPRRFRHPRLAGDAGQAFPIYITAVAGLLFLALALFAVGQAGATRNGGQTAADAAALGAAEDFRAQLRKGLLDAITGAITDEQTLEDLLNGRGFHPLRDPCDQAQWFAGENDADVTDGGCVPGYLPVSFTVTVETQKAVGKSVIPGTETKHATARAKAVVEPRCTYEAPAPLPDPTDDGKGDNGKGDDDKDDGGKGDGGDGKDEGGKDEKPVIGLVCEGKDITIDPEHLDLFPDAKDLFSVHLAD